MSPAPAFVPAPPRVPPRHRPRGFSIVHEDADLLVIDKDPGVLTVSYHDNDKASATYLLTRYLRKGGARSRAQAWCVHRLDRETSGLLVFAKSYRTQQALKNSWASTEKLYLVAVHGLLREKAGVLQSYLAEDDDQFVHAVADARQGRLARSAYAVIRETPALSLLCVRLLTGRKNQIRVQFADLGHPVAGDPKYGKKDRFHQRMALHARALAFDHPARPVRAPFLTPFPDFFLRLFPGLAESDWQRAADASAQAIRPCNLSSAAED